MRSREFLSEASIFTRPERYTFGHKVKIAATSSKGKVLLNKIQDAIPTFDPTEELEWVSINNSEISGAVNIDLSGNRGTSNRRYFKRPDGEYISIEGTDSAIQGGLIHASGQKGSVEGNIGDLSEPVLSAAVVAKLIKRGGNSIENIDSNDVIRTLNAAVDRGDSSYTVTDKNSKVADIIKFTVAVREPTRIFMQRPDFWEKYGTLLPAVVHYANSGQIDRYADHFYKNGKVDVVWVKSDGMSDQKGKKTDIEAFVKTEDGSVKPLKNLKISLKAGSSQFGQQGAGSITADVNSVKGVLQSTRNFFEPLGVDIPQPYTNITNKVSWWTAAYKTAFQQLKTALAGQDTRTESGVVAKIASMILHHSTKGDEQVRLVQLSKKGVSTVHSFSKLKQKLIDENINLTVSYREGKGANGDPRPELNIYDATSGKSLVKLAYHATGDNKKIWNSITMEVLLSELTTMSRSPQAAAPVTAPSPAPPTEPVTTPPSIVNQTRTMAQGKISMGSTADPTALK